MNSHTTEYAEAMLYEIEDDAEFERAYREWEATERLRCLAEDQREREIILQHRQEMLDIWNS
jgi:hypothetical protein